MGYIVRLISEGAYLIPVDGMIGCTKSREEAIQEGQFDDFDAADETAQCFSGGMTRGVDYVIESASTSKWHVVEVTVAESICPKIKGIEKFVKDGKASLYLTNTTTSDDAMNGFTRYGVSSGANAILVTNETFSKSKEEIEEYLNNRFGSQWSIQLTPVKTS